MKPRKVGIEVPAEPRRSSRIQEHATKRKTEEELHEVTPKKSKHSNDGNSLFSIFTKKESKHDTPKSSSKRNDKQSKLKNVPKQELENITSERGHSADTRAQVCSEGILIDLIDIDSTSEQVSCNHKPSVEYNFVSAFVEQELPSSFLNNHVQQLTQENNILCDVHSTLTFRNNSLENDSLVSIAGKLATVNCYFSNQRGKSGELLANSVQVQTAPDPDCSIWVEKYKPKCTADILCHPLGSQLLVNWLREWKQKLKHTRNRTDNSNSGSSFDISDEDDDMLKCVILSGRCGRGKTSAVYAVAQELGFKIFEINPSSNRVGRHILSQLQEATLSHHVEGLPKLSSFFGQIPKAISLGNATTPRAVDSVNGKERQAPIAKLTKLKPRPGSITNFFKKTSEDCVSPQTDKPKVIQKAEKKNSLLNFFKPQVKSVTEPDINANKDAPEIEDKMQVFCVSSDEVVKSEKACNETVVTSSKVADDRVQPIRKKYLKKVCMVTDESSSSNDMKENSDNSSNDEIDQSSREKNYLIEQKRDQDPKTCEDNYDPIDAAKLKFSSLSLILFDDADVNLELDEGFWSSINTFLKVTRKPVILTTSHNPEELCEFINSEFNVLDFDIMSADLACEYLKSVNSQEGLSFTDCELRCLLKHCNYDLRQCTLQLQFWTSFKKPRSSHSDSYGISLPLLCLDDYARENICKWIFEWDVVPAVEVLLRLNTSLLRNNIDLWLPFKKVSHKTKEKRMVTKPVKKFKRLDISWLSDEESDDEKVKESSSPNNTNPEVTATTLSPFTCKSLDYLSQWYDNISEADVIFKCEHVTPNSFWMDGLKLLPKNEHSSSLGTEVSTWINLLSSRHCRNELQKLPVNDICIYSDGSNTVNFGSTVASNAKLVQCRQNIASGVLCLQRQNHADICLDYLSMLRKVYRCERERKENNCKRSRRFLHYFEASGFTVEMEDLLEIAKAFN